MFSRRSYVALLALTILATVSWIPANAQTRAPRRFRPAQPLSVSNIEYPPASIAIGTVVLQAELNEAGEVISVRPIREIASLTPEAVRAVKTWRFKPARLNGKAISSTVMVAVTFNPAVENPTDVPLPPPRPGNEAEMAKLQYRPPDVAAAAFPLFPIGGVSWGAVVLNATIDDRGEVERSVVLRDVVPLTAQANRALAKWRFTPARFDGKPVRAGVVIAFVFRLPSHNSQ